MSAIYSSSLSGIRICVTTSFPSSYASFYCTYGNGHIEKCIYPNISHLYPTFSGYVLNQLSGTPLAVGQSHPAPPCSWHRLAFNCGIAVDRASARGGCWAGRWCGECRGAVYCAECGQNVAQQVGQFIGGAVKNNDPHVPPIYESGACKFCTPQADTLYAAFCPACQFTRSASMAPFAVALVGLTVRTSPSRMSVSSGASITV